MLVWKYLKLIANEGVQSALQPVTKHSLPDQLTQDVENFKDWKQLLLPDSHCTN